MSEENLTVENPEERRRLFEMEQERLQKEYEDMMAQGTQPVYHPSPSEVEVETLRAQGHVIPEVTPQEPPVLIERVPVTDNQAGALPIGRDGRVGTIEHPNPNYVSEEMRAQAIADARQKKLQPETALNGPVITTDSQTFDASKMLQYANHIQESLPDLTVVGCKVEDGQLVVTFT